MKGLRFRFLFLSRYVELRWRRRSEIREPEVEDDAIGLLAITRCVFVECFPFFLN